MQCQLLFAHVVSRPCLRMTLNLVLLTGVLYGKQCFVIVKWSAFFTVLYFALR
uniref:Uncharacterized protein n=1 Tax=Anguilla anguilla TaxID=7936 RepID=A0A0E9PBH2_ANGAN